MAQLVSINEGDPSEVKAQRYLRDHLPDSWIVTTNVDERNFEGLGLKIKTELDCVLITPVGVFVLDFKNYRGSVIPSQSGRWKVNDRYVDNPFSQRRKHEFALKELLKRSAKVQQQAIWIEGLIVFTARGVKLDWSASDIDHDDLRSRAISISQVESSVRKIASGRNFSVEVARTALAALKPAEVPPNLFDSWRDQREAHSDQDQSSHSSDILFDENEGIPFDHEPRSELTLEDLEPPDGEDPRPPEIVKMVRGLRIVLHPEGTAIVDDEEEVRELKHGDVYKFAVWSNGRPRTLHAQWNNETQDFDDIPAPPSHLVLARHFDSLPDKPQCMLLGRRWRRYRLSSKVVTLKERFREILKSKQRASEGNEPAHANLTIKQRLDRRFVRQSFSHGRTKVVAVEKRRRRSIGSAKLQKVMFAEKLELRNTDKTKNDPVPTAAPVVAETFDFRSAETIADELDRKLREVFRGKVVRVGGDGFAHLRAATRKYERKREEGD